MKKTYRIKTNNQEQLQRKQNESDATSTWIEFQKTRPRRRNTRLEQEASRELREVSSWSWTCSQRRARALQKQVPASAAHRQIPRKKPRICGTVHRQLFVFIRSCRTSLSSLWAGRGTVSWLWGTQRPDEKTLSTFPSLFFSFLETPKCRNY